MTNIYVGNLAFSTTEEELRQVFSEHGAVNSVSLVKDRETGRSRGFAFVEMPNNSEAAKAIELLNLAQIGGRSMTVNEAKPRTDRPRQGGGGGGGGYGSRRKW